MNKKQYVFGPVPSRRLGFSLGIDINPLKACTYDCIYCEAGCTTDKSPVGKAWYDPKEIIAQICESLAGCTTPDHITFSGSGEPTLNSGLGTIIKGIKNFTNVPVAVITNSSLLFMDEVKRDLEEADVLLPTMVDTQSKAFRTIHRPAPDIDPADIQRGLMELRDWFKGTVRLEVMIMGGINDTDKDAQAMAQIARSIKPDIIDINTLVRPAPTQTAKAVSHHRLEEIARLFGPRAQIIAPFSKQEKTSQNRDQLINSVLSTARIRPLTIEDIQRLCALEHEEVSLMVKDLVITGHLEARQQDDQVFYQTKR